MSDTYAYVCVGLTILDILGRPIGTIPEGGKTTIIEQIRITPAGTAAGPAVIGARYGMKTALIGAIGMDDMGDILLAMLRKNGVDTGLMQTRSDMPTSATMLAVSPSGERPNFHAIGASVMLELDDTRTQAITGSRFVHWGGVGTMLLLDGDPSANILKTAKANGATITCDFIAPLPQTLDALKKVLPHVDYFMPSMEEAMEVAGTRTPEDTASYFLDAGAGACIFKWGKRGSLFANHDGTTRIPAFEVNALDTTGCGDAYCAGFAAALARGWDMEDACRFATATSALVATGLGSDAGVVGFEETVAAMRKFNILDVA